MIIDRIRTNLFTNASLVTNKDKILTGYCVILYLPKSLLNIDTHEIKMLLDANVDIQRTCLNHRLIHFSDYANVPRSLSIHLKSGLGTRIIKSGFWYWVRIKYRYWKPVIIYFQYRMPYL